MNNILPGGYFFTPVVENTAQTVMGTSENQRLVTIKGAEVKLDATLAGGDEFTFSSDSLQNFTVRTSGSVEPDGGTISLGFEILGIDHIMELQSAVSPDAPAQVIAKVVVFGELSDGGVESEPFEYPVTVCEGCLTVDVGACADLPADFETQLTGGECNPLQDAAVECCTDADGNLVCPAVSTASPM